MSKSSHPRAIAFISAFAVVAFIFLITLFWRLNLAAEITTSRSEIVTAQLYAWLQNWIHEGPFSIHFMMPYLPLSIESPGLQYRDELYRSYPPGALVPVYLLSELHRASPITVLTGYGLAEHATLVAAIFSAVFMVTARIARAAAPSNERGAYWSSALLATSAGIFMTVASGPAYFFARVYVWDTAVVPWFGIALLLEAVHTTKSGSPRTASIVLGLQMLVFTIGLWIDWLFVIVIFVWVALRIAEHLLLGRGAISAWRPVGIATATFVTNMALISAWRILAGLEQAGDLTVWDELKRTVYKLVYRAGLTSEDAITVQWFFDQLRSNLTNYFSVGVWQFTLLLVASSLCIAIAFSLARRLRLMGSFWPLASLALLSTAPPVIYLCLLPQHAYFHDFSILKFAMPMALTILTLAPASVALLLARASALHFRISRRGAGMVFSSVACLAAISGIYFSMTRFAAPQQHFPPIRGGIGVLGTIIERNVEYADVVFSPQFEIGHMTAEAGFSRKLVHRSSDVDKDLPEVTRYVCTPFNLVVVSDGIDEPKRADPPSEIRRDSGLVFYRWRNLQPKRCAGSNVLK